MSSNSSSINIASSKNAQEVEGSNMPRRPLTAYLLYQSEQDLGRKWSKLTAKQHAKYAQMRTQDLARYQAAMRAWNEAGGDDQHEIPRPKKTLSQYILFSKEQNISAKWRAESKEVRDAYKQRAKAMLDEYHAKMEAYQAKFGASALDAPDWPARPLAAYMRFAQEKRASFRIANPTMTTAQIGQGLGEMWRAMSDAEKKTYNDAYEQEAEQWAKDVAAYEARWGSIKFIESARKKEAARLKTEGEKEKEQQKRETEREKNKAKRERIQLKVQKERTLAAMARERQRAKKQKQKQNEKALRQGFVLYKREHRMRLKKRAGNESVTMAELNAQLTTMWDQLTPTTKKTWANRAAVLREEAAAAQGAVMATEAVATAAAAPSKKKAKTSGKRKQRSEKEDEEEQEGEAAVAAAATETPAEQQPPAKRAKKIAAAAAAKVAKKTVAKPSVPPAVLRKAKASFLALEKAKLMKKNPNLKAAQLTTMANEKWQSLSVAVRNKRLAAAAAGAAESTK